MKNKVIGVIPVRLESTRLPRKALADICGIPMVIHVLTRAKMSPVLDSVYVATDSEEIASVVTHYGGEVIMTSDFHSNGIERVEEATRSIDCDIVVLINGDEAALHPNHIESSVSTLLDSNALTSLLASPFSRERSYSDFKVVLNKHNEALYFSREDLPSPSRSGLKKFLKAYHIISFKKEALAIYTGLEKLELEKIEGHDHLRFLEHGLKVKIGIVDHSSYSIDTPMDLAQIRQDMVHDSIFSQYRNIATL